MIQRGTTYPQALIFDMDGLLLDTESIYQQIFEHACSQVGWPSPNMAIYSQCMGAPEREIEEILRKFYGPSFPYEAVEKIWRESYVEHFLKRPVDVKPGARELLSYCRNKDIPCGLATSTNAQLAARKLALAELGHFFSVIVTADDVRRGKPDPEPFSTAAQRLGISPEHCWALEDSPHGVHSAMGAGCQVFQVPSLVEPSQELRALGHTIVDSLQDVLRALRGIEQPQQA